jgi:hypothetical protein
MHAPADTRWAIPLWLLSLTTVVKRSDGTRAVPDEHQPGEPMGEYLTRPAGVPARTRIHRYVGVQCFSPMNADAREPPSLILFLGGSQLPQRLTGCARSPSSLRP